MVWGCFSYNPLDVLWESWEGKKAAQGMNLVSYVLKIREQLMSTTAIARELLKPSQAK